MTDAPRRLSVVCMPRWQRRRFLISVGGMCGALASLSPIPALAGGGGTRCVSLVHTHTGETLRAQYFRDGGYQEDCLTQVNYLLRDFRTGDIHRIDPALLDILFNL